MEERFVIVGKYTRSVEAHLAYDRLCQEGIRALLEGETAEQSLGPWAFDQIRLLVPEGEAGRAVGILASCFADEPYGGEEERTDEDGPEDGWACPVCGEAVPLDWDVCPSCQEERGAYQKDPPGPTVSWRPPAERRTEQGDIRKMDDITPPSPAPLPGAAEEEPSRPLKRELLPVDLYAAGAFWSAIAGAALILICLGLTPPHNPFPLVTLVSSGLTLYSCWLLLRTASYLHPLSRSGSQMFYTALILNGLALSGLLIFFAM
jgi:hypothetical protein